MVTTAYGRAGVAEPSAPSPVSSRRCAGEGQVSTFAVRLIAPSHWRRGVAVLADIPEPPAAAGQASPISQEGGRGGARHHRERAEV